MSWGIFCSIWAAVRGLHRGIEPRTLEPHPSAPPPQYKAFNSKPENLRRKKHVPSPNSAFPEFPSSLYTFEDNYAALSKSQLAAAEHGFPDLLMCPLQLRQTWFESIGAVICQSTLDQCSTALASIKSIIIRMLWQLSSCSILFAGTAIITLIAATRSRLSWRPSAAPCRSRFGLKLLSRGLSTRMASCPNSRIIPASVTGTEDTGVMGFMRV